MLFALERPLRWCSSRHRTRHAHGTEQDMLTAQNKTCSRHRTRHAHGTEQDMLTAQNKTCSRHRTRHAHGTEQALALHVTCTMSMCEICKE
jgi:hypothetical protein